MAVTVSNVTNLANQIQSRINALNSASASRDLLYLAKIVQTLNGNLGLATVLEAGDTAATNLAATANTQIGQVNATGAANAASLNSLTSQKSAELTAIANQLASALQGYGMTQTKQFFMAQS